MTIPRPTLLKEKCIIDEPHDLSDNGWTVAQYEELRGDSMIIRLPWGQKESFHAYAHGSNRDYIAKLCDIYGYDISEHEELEGEYIWVKVKSLSVTGDTLKVVPAMAPEIPEFADQYDMEEIFEHGHTQRTQDELDEDDTIDGGMDIEDVEKLYDARYYIEKDERFPDYEGWVEGEITEFDTHDESLIMKVWTPLGEKTYPFDIYGEEIENVVDMYGTKTSEFQTLTGRTIHIMVQDIYLDHGEVCTQSSIIHDDKVTSADIGMDESDGGMLDISWNGKYALYAYVIVVIMLSVLLFLLLV